MSLFGPAKPLPDQSSSPSGPHSFLTAFSLRCCKDSRSVIRSGLLLSQNASGPLRCYQLLQQLLVLLVSGQRRRTLRRFSRIRYSGWSYSEGANGFCVCFLSCDHSCTKINMFCNRLFVFFVKEARLSKVWEMQEGFLLQCKLPGKAQFYCFYFENTCFLLLPTVGILLSVQHMVQNCLHHGLKIHCLKRNPPKDVGPSVELGNKL